MTYRELLYKAQRLINNNEITLGEYDEMTKPLDEEIRKKGKWIENDKGVMICSCCNTWFPKERKEFMLNCPYCMAEMEDDE